MKILLHITLVVAQLCLFCGALRRVVVRRERPLQLQPLSLSARSDSMQWSSAVSTSSDFRTAVAEALEAASASLEDKSKIRLVLTYVSSIYESTSSFDFLDEDIRKIVPENALIIGCTTGGVIGRLSTAAGGDGLPVECEARASVGVTLACVPDGVTVNAFGLDKDETKEYIESSDKFLTSDGKDRKTSVSMIFATESVKALVCSNIKLISTFFNGLLQILCI